MNVQTDDPLFELRHGQRFSVIQDVGEFRPFLINVVTASDLWMFLSSHGGLTAGRGSAQGSIFPYETVDRLHDAHHTTGPCCLIRAGGKVWEPFAESADDSTKQRILKNDVGNQVVFVSLNETSQLEATQRWSSAESLGHVRTVTITNHSSKSVSLDILDGIRNILPWGVELSTQQFASCLVDAYKRCEVEAETGMGLYCLASRITDRADPAEALRANVVWSVGLEGSTVALGMHQTKKFRGGREINAETLLTGDRGCYFLHKAGVTLQAGESVKWHVILDTGLDHVEIVGLRESLLARETTSESVEASIVSATNDLMKLVGSADGLQTTSSDRASIHHFANTTFNCMRGGVFTDHHRVPSEKFRRFVQAQSKKTADRNASFLSVLGESLEVHELRSACEDQNDPNLVRLCYEFLPLTFSRRHGDPSRPWNSFAIKLRDDDGNKVIHYEGNWRDIFQNWESTCTSFPAFLPGVIARFVNASSADGFNPYRVTSEFLEWEIPNPEDPWSHIGYWGDHQIIYLLKLLETLNKIDPDQLGRMLDQDCFTYLQIPYRLRPYGELVKNRRHTIEFDWELQRALEARVEQYGQDGKLLRDEENSVYFVSLAEKVLIPALSKISNLVVAGGIWMNTQRPEWNDANNALVGNGVSVVTLAYLHRYSSFLLELLRNHETEQFAISREVANWLQQVTSVLEKNREALNSGVNDHLRREILDALGEAFSDFRTIVYDHGLSKRHDIDRTELERFFDLVRIYCEHSLLANEREDGLYHSYNLLQFEGHEALGVRHLHEMLEGQVAAIASKALSCSQVINVVEKLFDSRMYRDDQYTFMLYPEVKLADFIERNVIPEKRVKENSLLSALVKAGNHTIVQEDAMGVYRFHGDFSGATDVRSALDLLAEDSNWAKLVEANRDDVIDLFCNIFQHYSYTGRSGTMYRYEGIGCIYWHMISKLLQSVQETYHRAIAEKQSAPVIQRLSELYFQLRRGLCYEKSANEYGAFPTDPYSHTPRHTGAEQPGMTGQVKEGILIRWGELGVRVKDGCVEFQPRLLEKCEFVSEPTRFQFVEFNERMSEIELESGELGFTYCQVPVIYRSSDRSGISVKWSDGKVDDVEGSVLPTDASMSLLSRRGELAEIRVEIDSARLVR